MPQITIDNHPYDLDTLSDDARAQLTSLHLSMPNCNNRTPTLIA